MHDLPHPDSDEIGRLIGQYLSHRRRSGWDSRHIQREAEHLGDAAANHWKPATRASQQALQRLVRWRKESGEHR